MVTIKFINSLAKKHMGAAAIIFNEKGELLIVKPNYNDGWLVPGGSLDAIESPTDGCIREIKEEIGLEIPDIRCTGIFYSVGKTEEEVMYDSMQFTFYAGVLSDEQIKNIVLQEKELTEFRFVSLDEAYTVLRPRLAYRIKLSMDSIKNNTCVYHEQKTII